MDWKLPHDKRNIRCFVCRALSKSSQPSFTSKRTTEIRPQSCQFRLSAIICYRISSVLNSPKLGVGQCLRLTFEKYSQSRKYNIYFTHSTGNIWKVWDPYLGSPGSLNTLSRISCSPSSSRGTTLPIIIVQKSLECFMICHIARISVFLSVNEIL